VRAARAGGVDGAAGGAGWGRRVRRTSCWLAAQQNGGPRTWHSPPPCPCQCMAGLRRPPWSTTRPAAGWRARRSVAGLREGHAEGRQAQDTREGRHLDVHDLDVLASARARALAVRCHGRGRRRRGLRPLRRCLHWRKASRDGREGRRADCDRGSDAILPRNETAGPTSPVIVRFGAPFSCWIRASRSRGSQLLERASVLCQVRRSRIPRKASLSTHSTSEQGRPFPPNSNKINGGKKRRFLESFLNQVCAAAPSLSYPRASFARLGHHELHGTPAAVPHVELGGRFVPPRGPRAPLLPALGGVPQPVRGPVWRLEQPHAPGTRRLHLQPVSQHVSGRSVGAGSPDGGADPEQEHAAQGLG